MKNTKNNVIELLKKRREIAREILIECKKDGDKRNHDVYLGKLYVYDEVIDLLTDEEFFNYILDSYIEWGLKPLPNLAIGGRKPTQIESEKE